MSRQTNKTPFTDLCTLVSRTDTRGSDGYTDTETPEPREVVCSVNQGVVRQEFYEAYKAGIRLTLTVELHEGDYQNEQLLRYDAKDYRVVRVYPTGHGTLELACEEVVR